MKIHLDTCPPLEDKTNTLQCIKDGEISKHGNYRDRFETEIKKLTNTNRCVTTSNCTDALTACLMAIGVKDQEVIIPDITFHATMNAVLMAGGIPIIAGVNKKNWCISTNRS